MRSTRSSNPMKRYLLILPLLFCVSAFGQINTTLESDKIQNADETANVFVLSTGEIDISGKPGQVVLINVPLELGSTILDSGGVNASVSPSARTLIANDGTTVMLDWSDPTVISIPGSQISFTISTGSVKSPLFEQVN